MSEHTGSPRAVLFDALGTLVALEDPAPRLSGLLRERLSLSLTPAQAREALSAEIVFYRANFQSGADSTGLARLRERCAEVLREALAGAVVRDRPAEARLRAAPLSVMVEMLLDSLRFRVFPDAVQCLDELRGRGIRTAVVSNWDCSLPGVLEEVGLAPRLDAIVTSAALGIPKPDPAIFHHVLGLLGARGEQSVHVGDSMLEDVLGARAAGIRGMLIARAGGAPSGELEVIRSLREVTLAIDREHPFPPGT